jgi:hypothetical protein
MRSISSHRLWIGHAGDLRDPRGILDAEISAVIDLAADEPVAVLPRELVYLRFPILDGSGNTEWLLRAAIQTTAALLRDKVPIALCCSGGMSRSVLIAAAGLSLASGRDFDQALSEIAGGPTDVSPALLAEIASLTRSFAASGHD